MEKGEGSHVGSTFSSQPRSTIQGSPAKGSLAEASAAGGANRSKTRLYHEQFTPYSLSVSRSNSHGGQGEMDGLRIQRFSFCRERVEVWMNPVPHRTTLASPCRSSRSCTVLIHPGHWGTHRVIHPPGGRPPGGRPPVGCPRARWSVSGYSNPRDGHESGKSFPASLSYA